MVQRLGDLSKWTVLTEGKGLHFANGRTRNVRLQVNAAVKTALQLIPVDHETGEVGDPQFLALVEGLDVVEFLAEGPFQLTVEGFEAWIYTADGADISSVITDARSFTKIVERRRRNPEFEAMFAMMNRNLETRLAAERETFGRQLALQQAAIAAATGAPSGAVPEPAPAGSGGTGTESTAVDQAAPGGTTDGGTS